MVQVNVAAVVALTHLYLPRMIERRRGDILIVSSTAAFQGLPYLATYAATKASCASPTSSPPAARGRREILAVTFTNKAAREMKQRVGAMVGQVVEGMPWLGTFHSIGVKILRRHAELVGLKPDFTILDVDDQIRLLKQLLAAENIDEKRWPARVLALLIDGWKNRGLTPDQVPAGRSRELRQRQGARSSTRPIRSG